MSIGKIKDSTRTAEKVLVGAASDSIFSLLVAKAPYLKLPIINTFARSILDRCLYWMSEQGIIWFNIVWIRVNVSADASRLERARQKAILAMDGTVMDKELERLDDEIRKAFDDLHRGNRNPI